MLKKYLNNKGFSLPELLIVVLIVITISAISFNYYRISLEKSKAVEALSVLRQIADAQMIYYRENRVFTDDITKLSVNFDGDTTDVTSKYELKHGLFSYWAQKPSSSGEKVFNIARAERENKYEIFAEYNKEEDFLTFKANANGSGFTKVNSIDRKIVETINSNGKL